jgi:hypothetical protein
MATRRTPKQRSSVCALLSLKIHILIVSKITRPFDCYISTNTV